MADGELEGKPVVGHPFKKCTQKVRSKSAPASKPYACASAAVRPALLGSSVRFGQLRTAPHPKTRHTAPLNFVFPRKIARPAANLALKPRDRQRRAQRQPSLHMTLSAYFRVLSCEWLQAA